MLKKINMLALSGLFVLMSGSAYAETGTPVTDLSGLVSGIDFTDVKTAVLAVAASIIGVLVVMKGIRWLKASIR